MPKTPHRPSRPVQIRPSGVIAPLDQDEVEKQLALRDVMEYAVRETRAVATAKHITSWRSRPIILTAIAIPLALLSVFSLIAKPDFVYGPSPASVPEVRRTAEERFAIYLVAQRVLAYRETEKRLPESLEAAGEEWDGIGYRAMNDSVFELRSLADTARPVVFRSNERIDPFLGTSVTLLKRRRQ